MIDMKKKMAIVLSAVLACSMSITAVAAPSPTIAQEMCIRDRSTA